MYLTEIKQKTENIKGAKKLLFFIIFSSHILPINA